MKYTLGFSPCPNDCFIFDAMLHGKIDTEGLTFKPVIEDVEALNRRAATSPPSPLLKRGVKKQLDITKLSFFAYAKARKDYATSDKIRKQLNNLGIELKDEKDGGMSWNK